MRKLLMTTAVAVAMAAPAMAATETDGFVNQVQAGDHYGSELIGKRLYVSEAEVDDSINWDENARADWNDVGEINDLLIGQDGEVKAVLLDIGGFLGIGEKTIAVDMDQLKFVSESNDAADYFVVIQGSKAMLDTAPAFDTAMDVPMDTGATATEDTAENGTVTEKPMDKEVMAEADANAEGANAVQTMANEDTATEDPMATEEVAEGDAANEEPMATEEVAEGDAANEEPMATEEMADGNSSMWDAPAIERDGYETVASTDLTADMLEGTYVYDSDEENIGEIADLIVTADGNVDKALVDVGGFLGIGEHRIAVDFDELQVIRQENGAGVEVHIAATKEQLEDRPEYED